MAKVIPHAPKPSGKKSATIAANAFAGFNTSAINAGLLPVGYAQPEVSPGKGATIGADTAGGNNTGKVGNDILTTGGRYKPLYAAPVAVISGAPKVVKSPVVAATEAATTNGELTTLLEVIAPALTAVALKIPICEVVTEAICIVGVVKLQPGVGTAVPVKGVGGIKPLAKLIIFEAVLCISPGVDNLIAFVENTS